MSATPPGQQRQPPQQLPAYGGQQQQGPPQLQAQPRPHQQMMVQGGGGSAGSTVQATPFRRFQKSYAMTVPGGYSDSGHGCYEGMLTCLGSWAGSLGAIPCCLCDCCFPNPFKQVPQGRVGLISKFGKFVRAVDPGLYKINPYCENMVACDIRMQAEDIPRQLILTKDNVSVDIDSVLYWDIVDPYIATFLVADVRKALIERTQTTLRQILGNRTLQDTIENRDAIGQEICESIDKIAEQWGVNVESILLKDVILGKDIQDNMAAAAKQKRIGESKVIAAQAEVDSAKLMREAADILNSPAAMQIRYLETLNVMSAQAGTKVIFLPPASSGARLTASEAFVYDKMSD